MNTFSQTEGFGGKDGNYPVYSHIRMVYKFFYTGGVWFTDDFGNAVRSDAHTIIRHIAEGSRSIPCDDGWTV